MQGQRFVYIYLTNHELIFFLQKSWTYLILDFLSFSQLTNKLINIFFCLKPLCCSCSNADFVPPKSSVNVNLIFLLAMVKFCGENNNFALTILCIWGYLIILRNILVYILSYFVFTVLHSFTHIYYTNIFMTYLT